MFNPNALQQALAHDGIPALVKIGTRCSSSPSPGSVNGILSVQLPDGSPVTGPPGAKEIPVPAEAVNVINPAAIPAGTELMFQFLNNDRDLTFNLINIDSYTCVSGSGQ